MPVRRSRDPVVHIEGEVAPALEELEIQPAIDRSVGLPLQIRVPQRNLPVSGLDGGLGSTDVVERVTGAAAELGDDAPTRNLLVPGDPPSEPQHRVGEQATLREERLAGDPPAEAESGERTPLVTTREFGRAVAPQRRTGIVLLVVVVVHLAEVRQQAIEESRAAHRPGGRIAEGRIDVALRGIVIQETGDTSRYLPLRGRDRLLAEQHRQVMRFQGTRVRQRVRNRPTGRPVVGLGDRVGRVGLGILERRGGEPGELPLAQVEGESAARRESPRQRELGEGVADGPVAGVAVEAPRPCILERIRVVP